MSTRISPLSAYLLYCACELYCTCGALKSKATNTRCCSMLTCINTNETITVLHMYICMQVSHMYDIHGTIRDHDGTTRPLWAVTAGVPTSLYCPHPKTPFTACGPPGGLRGLRGLPLPRRRDPRHLPTPPRRRPPWPSSQYSQRPLEAGLLSPPHASS